MKGKELKQSETKKGYLQVTLCKNGKNKNYRVHKLVAESFLPNKTEFKYDDIEMVKEIKIEKLQINHKDGNKLNNCVNNLEWCTNLYNQRYEKTISNKYKAILQLDLNGNVINKWESQKEAEKHLGFRIHISEVCKGKRKTAGGFKWKYLKLT